MALIGNHQINLRLSQDSKLGALHFDHTIEFNEFDYSFEKRFGSDTWHLNAGKVLTETLQLLHQPQNASSKIRIKNLKILEFKKGIMQWSAHQVSVGLDFELIKNGKSLRKGRLKGVGTGKGTEFGFLTFIPIIGNMNFDKGIEVALFRSLESALSKLRLELES